MGGYDAANPRRPAKREENVRAVGVKGPEPSRGAVLHLFDDVLVAPFMPGVNH